MYVVDDALFTKMGEVCEQNGMKIYDASVPPHILQEWELEVLKELIKEDMQQMKDQIKKYGIESGEGRVSQKYFDMYSKLCNKLGI